MYLASMAKADNLGLPHDCIQSEMHDLDIASLVKHTIAALGTSFRAVLHKAIMYV